MKRANVLFVLLLACRGESTIDAVTTAGTSNPLSMHALAPEERVWFEGSIEERLPAGSYVYLRLRTEESLSVWVATLAATAPSAPVERARVLVLGHAERFHSRRLARDFSPLSFGVVRPHSPQRD